VIVRGLGQVQLAQNASHVLFDGAFGNGAATQAAHAAMQAAAAASAHELAVAAMVHPDVIIANRVRLLSLCTTNCLAQVSPMIDATGARSGRRAQRTRVSETRGGD
jgi:PPE-repeat protein